MSGSREDRPCIDFNVHEFQISIFSLMRPERLEEIKNIKEAKERDEPLYIDIFEQLEFYLHYKNRENGLNSQIIEELGMGYPTWGYLHYDISLSSEALEKATAFAARLGIDSKRIERIETNFVRYEIKLMASEFKRLLDEVKTIESSIVEKQREISRCTHR